MNKRIALVTGSNKGVGYQIARQLGKLHNTIIVTARNLKLGKEAVNQLQQESIECHFVTLDVTDEKSIEKAVQYTQETFGKLDILVNNAGIFLDMFKKISELTLQEFRQTMETNLLGVFAVTKAFLPLLKKSEEARIINLSSDLGSLSQASDVNSKYNDVLGASYRASKAALNMLTLRLAHELKSSNIIVNAVSPGWCKTDLGTDAAPRSAMEGADTPVWVATQYEEIFNGNFLCNREKIAW